MGLNKPETKLELFENLETRVIVNLEIIEYPNMIKCVILVLLVVQCFGAKSKGNIVSKALYEFSNSYVTSITKLNFDSQIKKIRETSKNVGIVHYYKPTGPLFLNSR